MLPTIATGHRTQLIELEKLEVMINIVSIDWNSMNYFLEL